MSDRGRPPGWYPDPDRPGLKRWWDGIRWADAHAAAVPGNRPEDRATPEGYAVASLVTALLGFPVLPIVLGFVARRRIRQSGGFRTGSGLAMGGIVIGFVSTAALLVLAVLSIGGAFEQENAADYKGRDAEVARTIDAYEQAAKKRDLDRLCGELLTPEFARELSRSPGPRCQDHFSASLPPGDRWEIVADQIHARGREATALVDDDGVAESWSLVRSGTGWRVSSID